MGPHFRLCPNQPQIRIIPPKHRYRLSNLARSSNNMTDRGFRLWSAVQAGAFMRVRIRRDDCPTSIASFWRTPAVVI
jgi:hypothetical protein